MDVKVLYSRYQLEATINYIAKHNVSMRDEHAYIRKSIMGNISEMVEKFPHLQSIGTMGYIIEGHIEYVEGIDDEENVLRLEFWVDPALSLPIETHEEIYRIKRETFPDES